MKTYNKFVYGVCAAIFLSLGPVAVNAQAQTCEDNPAAVTTLDCADLRNAVLHSVRNKHQSVSLPLRGGRALQTEQRRGANAVYKDFLHWTAARDRVTIGNLLSESKRSSFDPYSPSSEGYTVAWLNVPSVDMDAYYDEFWAQRSVQVVMTHRPVGTSQAAMRD